MPYTRDKGRDFWFDLDNQTLFRRTPEVNNALQQAYFVHGMTFDSYVDALRTSFSLPDHPAQFLSVVGVGQQGILELAGIQSAIMLTHLEDNTCIQSGFEDFGQGVLLDNRPPRPTGRKIHMMDGTPDTWVGYQRWHAFARAAGLLGADAALWLHIDRCIALAWAIQTETNPPLDNPDNPGLPEERLQILRTAWMALSSEKLDLAFTSNQFRAPAPELLADWHPGLGRYVKVQRILSDAAGHRNPFHLGADGVGHGRFWELSYADFMNLPLIYDVKLIADPGPDRGSRSGLVKVLRHGAVEGESEQPDIPRMPLDGPYLQDSDIQFIQDWIDADCPED